MNPNQIGTEDINFFQENGYFQIHNFFDKLAISELKHALDKTIEDKRAQFLDIDDKANKNYNQVFNQMVNLWVDYENIRKYSFDARMAEIARKLSCSRHLMIYHDHGLIKPGGQNSRATNWHQDAPYWPMEQVGALSAWIAVDNVTVDNGCMQFIPGSHKYGRLPPVKLDIEGESVLSKIGEKGLDKEPVVMEMESVGITFHHGCTFHYATPNYSNLPRRALAIIYIPDNVNYNGGWNAGGDHNLKIGEPFCGPQHPILASG